MERNRYGKYFKSAIDYQISYFNKQISPNGYVTESGQFIETGGLSASVDKRKLMHRQPTKMEIIENVKNLNSWGFRVSIDNDMIIGKDGALITLINKDVTLDDLVKDSEFIQQLISEGYQLKIGEGYSEKPLYPGYEEYQTNVIQKRNKDSVATKNGLYCINFKDFFIPIENLKYTDNANLLRVASGKEPVFSQTQEYKGKSK